MSWLLGYFVIFGPQICIAVTNHNMSNLTADWKINSSSEQSNSSDLTGRLQNNMDLFHSEAVSGDLIENKTFSESLELGEDAGKSRGFFPTLIFHTSKDSSTALLGGENESVIKHVEGNGSIFNLVSNSSQVHEQEPENGAMSLGLDFYVEAHEEEYMFYDDNETSLNEDYYYPDYNPWLSQQLCFSTDPDQYPEESELPICESMEVEDVMAICELPELSCRNKCGEDLNDTMPATRTSCYCNAHCLLYNSCCEDFEELCPLTHVEAQQQLDLFQGKHALCTKHVRAMLIAECPHDTQDEQLRNQCENPDSSKITQLFPVTDSVSGHHFQNIYCWQCWSMTGESIPWQVTIRFTSQDVHENEYDSQPVLDVIAQMPWRTQWVPQLGRPVFYCESCAVSRCTGCADETKQRLCSKLNSVVEIDRVTYANKHCYTCSQEYLERYHLQNASEKLVQAECKVPLIPDYVKFDHSYLGYHSFEFYVVASVVKNAMHLDTDQHDLNDLNHVSFSWSSMNCPEDGSQCDVIECAYGFLEGSRVCKKPVSDGYLNIMLRPGQDQDNLPDLSPSSKFDISDIGLLNTVKRLYEERIENEFRSIQFTVKDWKSDIEHGALYLHYEATEGLFGNDNWRKLQTLVLVLAMEALNMYELPGLMYVCVGDYKYDIFYPVQMQYANCYPHVSHLGMVSRSRACSLLSDSVGIMWVMSVVVAAAVTQLIHYDHVGVLHKPVIS